MQNGHGLWRQTRRILEIESSTRERRRSERIPPASRVFSSSFRASCFWDLEAMERRGIKETSSSGFASRTTEEGVGFLTFLDAKWGRSFADWLLMIAPFLKFVLICFKQSTNSGECMLFQSHNRSVQGTLLEKDSYFPKYV